jgi:hypothetical protein
MQDDREYCYGQTKRVRHRVRKEQSRAEPQALAGNGTRWPGHPIEGESARARRHQHHEVENAELEGMMSHC